MRSLEREEDIRRRVLKLRMDLGASEWECGTQAIAKRIKEHAWFAEAEMIFCYVDFRGEVGMRGLIEESWRAGKRVCVPRMDGERMDFYEISSFSELGPGAFGIMEPAGGRQAFYDEKGLMILPGIAFDRLGNRVGYGKGCYDRYLAAHRKIRTIGAAFEFQIVDRIKTEKTDVRVDLLATEKGMY